MKRFRRALLAGLCAVALVAEPASATVAPDLSVKHVKVNGKRKIRLRSVLAPVGDPPQGCVVDRNVIFEKKKSGEWTKVGRDPSNAKGVAVDHISRKGHKGKYRARVPAKSLGDLVCPAETSNVVAHTH